MYKDANGHYRWRLTATNGKIIANSGEGYVNRGDCIAGMTLAMSTTSKTPWYDLTK